MATSQFKASLILVAFFGILSLACATSGNETKQSSCNMVGDLFMRLNLISPTAYVNF